MTFSTADALVCFFYTQPQMVVVVIPTPTRSQLGIVVTDLAQVGVNPSWSDMLIFPRTNLRSHARRRTSPRASSWP